MTHRKRIVWGQSEKSFQTLFILNQKYLWIRCDNQLKHHDIKTPIMTLASPYDFYVFKVLRAVTNDNRFRLCLWSYSAHMTFFGTPGSSQFLMSAQWLCLMACVKATLCHVTGGQWQEKETAANHNITHTHTWKKRDQSTLGGALKTPLSAVWQQNGVIY